MVRDCFSNLCLRCLFISVVLLFTCQNTTIYSQAVVYKFYYRIYFNDKGPVSINDFLPGELLSEKALKRREKSNITVPDLKDIPVYHGYLEKISSLGFKLHCTSKWLNTAIFKSEIQKDIGPILELPFVKKAIIVKDAGSKRITTDKLWFEIDQADTPPFDQPVRMLNGQSVHKSGFNGKGITIAVLDGGFDNSDNINSLAELRKRNGIKGTYDFVGRKEYVYGYHTHGTAVLSILAGNIPGSIEGTARDAEYWLLRSEDTSSEFPVEEDYWAAAAEFADSVGADIISSSLGYYAFDNPSLSYKFSDMDGNTAFVTQAADVAASKGILVVNSAGNERNKEWLHIIAPSDGDSVIAVGAVDWTGAISSFSSAGPSSDRRVKPDVVAQGVNVPVQVKTVVVERSSGTSFSCPVISGMSACIIQAVPQASNTEIIASLISSSDRYQSPDSLYGYGIPDITVAIGKLQEKYILKPDHQTTVGPNPFINELRIVFRQVPGSLGLELFDSGGRPLLKRDYSDFISRVLILDDFHDLSDGIYFLRLKTSNGTFVHKLIRISR